MEYLVHIGYPKAASSFLQSSIFSGVLDELKPLMRSGEPYIGYQKSGGVLFFNKIDGEIDCLNPFIFDSDKVKHEIKSAEHNSARVTCLTNELWAGHPFSGGVTAKEYANRIHKTLPQAKILIVIRNQLDMIFSSYVHFLVHSNGICSLKSFLSNNQHNQMPFHNISYYYYDYLVRYYHDLFGPENVLTLPFELLQQKGQAEFIKPIYDFLKIDSEANPLNFDGSEKNKADYRKYILLKRFPILNVFSSKGPITGYSPPFFMNLKRGVLKLLSPLISKKLIRKEIESDKALIASFMNDSIKKSNVELQKFVKQDLKSLGYFVD